MKDHFLEGCRYLGDNKEKKSQIKEDSAAFNEIQVTTTVSPH